MTPEIRKRFEKLERQKRTVFSDVEGWSATQLRFRQEPAGWSALDVLDHLVKVEKATLEAVNEHLPHGAPMTLKDRAGAWLVTWVMLSPMRVKVPASALKVLPETTTDLSGIAESWSEVRDQMANLLGSLQPEQFSIGLFRHPVSGWMTVTNALTFISAHLQHHKYQLRRLKSATRDL